MRDADPSNLSLNLDLTRPLSHEEHRRLFTYLLDTDFRPYTYNDTLSRRLDEPNRLMRQTPELVAQIDETLQADDDQSLLDLAEDLDLARQLYEPENTRPIGRILSYLNLTETTGQRADEDHLRARSNAVDALVAQKVADSFDEETLYTALESAAFVQMRLDDLDNQTLGNRFSILRAKAAVLRGEVKKRHSAYRYIDMLPEDADPEVASPEKVERDSRFISDLFSSIRSTQTYGVKMGYIRERTGGTLVFSPPFDLDSLEVPGTIHPILKKDFAAAEVVHSRKQKHPRLKLDFGQTMEGVAEVATTDLDPIAGMSIGKDGELYADSYGHVSIRDIAVKKRRYVAYRELQAHLLAHYHDLTHRLEDTHKIHQETGEKTDIPQPFAQTANPLESIERLVIPRVRFYKEEVAQPAETEDSEPPQPKVRRHNVTWHRRELPDGWHASPQALELAAKLGVTLKDNETLVKEHKRGSKRLGEVVAHQLIQNPQEID